MANQLWRYPIASRELRQVLNTYQDIAILSKRARRLLRALRATPMDDRQWRQYRAWLREKDLEADPTNHPNLNRHGVVRTLPDRVPVWPFRRETADEYGALYALWMASRDEDSIKRISDRVTLIVEDVAAFARVCSRGPRLHSTIVERIILFHSHRQIEVRGFASRCNSSL